MEQWEYAIITRWDNQVWIHYLHPNGKVSTTKPWSETEKGQPIFAGVLAHMGGRGWELITIQHGLWQTGQVNGGALLENDIKAYLKRPVTNGRLTNEPEMPFNLWD